MRKHLFIYILVFILILPVSTVYGAESVPQTDAPEIYSEAAIVMDATTGQILYEKNAYTTMYPASITKILTTLVALENSNPDDVITMTEDAVYGIDWDSSHIGLKVGEQITVRDALYATMLASANEAAWAVAEYAGGDLQTFCDMMNKRAKEIGCIGTNFVNANGLHNDGHYTCAYDMALITKEALKNPQFVEIASTKYRELEPTSYTPETRYLIQGNQMLLEDSEYYYPGVYGGKTGYTSMAQGTLVTWCEKNGVKLICVTMKASLSAYKYMDTKALFDYCYDKYTKATPLSSFEISPEEVAATEDFMNQYYSCENLGTLNLDFDKDTYVLVNKESPDSRFSVKYELSTENLDNMISGNINIYDGEELVHSVPVTYSGYINSTDEEAVEAAIAAGIIKRPIHFNFGKFILITLLLIIAFFVARYYLRRLAYVKKKRREYIRRRDKARKNGESF